MRYQKKPVVIDAWKSGDDGFFDESIGAPLMHQIGGTHEVFDRLHNTWIQYEPGDWVIRGLKGEFYPCKADVFEASYEPVQED